MKEARQRTTLLALHGFTLNGSVMRRQMGQLASSLAEHADLVFPDGPHACSTESVKRLYKMWRAPLPVKPYRRWWNAVDDGRVYEGWEETKEYMAALMEEHQPLGLIAFSQGAIVATALAALSQAEELPPIRFVILIAGGPPRAESLTPYLERPLELPSLHIWGDKDEVMSEAAPRLTEVFSSKNREICTWSGRHEIPDAGVAPRTIVDFVKRWV